MQICIMYAQNTISYNNVYSIGVSLSVIFSSSVHFCDPICYSNYTTIPINTYSIYALMGLQSVMECYHQMYCLDVLLTTLRHVPGFDSLGI